MSFSGVVAIAPKERLDAVLRALGIPAAGGMSAHSFADACTGPVEDSIPTLWFECRSRALTVQPAGTFTAMVVACQFYFSNELDREYEHFQNLALAAGAVHVEPFIPSALRSQMRKLIQSH